MRLSDITILFVIIVFPYFIILSLRGDAISKANYKRTEINRMIDTAIEDAASQLAHIDGDNNIVLQKDEAVKTLLESLWINLDIYEDELASEGLLNYIPVIAVVDYDGIHVLGPEMYTSENGTKSSELLWKRKSRFQYELTDYFLYFTLGEEVTLVKKATGEIIESKLGMLSSVDGSTELSSINHKPVFDEIKRTAIVGTLENNLGYYINRHNEYAQSHGIKYEFYLPKIEEADWQRTIEDVSIIAFFQGIPLGIGNQIFNSYAIGGARVTKATAYIFDSNYTDGFKYYHRKSCSLVTHPNNLLGDKKECAKAGYLPCSVCKP